MPLETQEVGESQVWPGLITGGDSGDLRDFEQSPRKQREQH